jgi:hypothetical protein
MPDILTALEEITNGNAVRDWRSQKVLVVHVVSPMFNAWHDKDERVKFIENSFRSMSGVNLPCVVIPHSQLEQEYDPKLRSALSSLYCKKN